MAAGPVQYKRKYTLWVLILLVIVCWPIAIVYYFTRPKVPVQELQPGAPMAAAYGAPPAGPAGQAGRFCPACGAGGQMAGTNCTACGKPIPP